ncbi:hypothetical protein [Streptomyces sp. NBC_01264]|uniref:hypothetical protein n=1 Tax=Streptomyces sp. NBC_01264 TaxID=2903804 RepID=UPI002254EA09|nr:hypothetical protein [Streptomyces sp. NBC_01264]MCX4776759.1 hypothetical protein [Streptomyces sp. NBC_01264]
MNTIYEATTALYAHHLRAAGLHPVMVTHKWQQPDLIAPHSDLDLRLVLDAAPASWGDFNTRVAAAHTAAVAADPAHGRLLEHPPGYAFTTAELDAGLVQPAEVATWSLVHGSQEILGQWMKVATAEPWTASDARFYWALLDARVAGRYRLAADATDNVHRDLSGYLRHCVAWHYVAPCWFAAACLATHSRSSGKLDALTRWRPGDTGRHAELFASHAGPVGSRPTLAPRLLMRHAHSAVEAALHYTPASFCEPDGRPGLGLRREWAMTAGMLRVKPARWRYYLDPPPGISTGYLIAREAKELTAAQAALERLAGHGTPEERSMAARVAAVLPPSGTPTSAGVLRDLLRSWSRAGAALGDFLTGPTQTMEGAPL